jgi:integrase
VLILANTGMRHGTETANLKWNNIEEFKDNSGESFLRFWVNGKTGPRELVARHSVRDYLKRIQSRFDDLKDLSFEDLTQINELVFRCRDGSKAKDWHGAFEILLTESGLLHDRHGKRRSLYSLRHTYATFALINNIDIHILAKQMGTSVYMIEKHYSHLIPSLSASQLAGKYFDLSSKS